MLTPTTATGARWANRKAILESLYSLARVLESVPDMALEGLYRKTSGLLSELETSRAAGWVDTVERLSKSLVEKLAHGDSLSEALALFAELNTREAEAQAFCSGIGARPGTLSWHAILDWAKSARQQLTVADALLKNEQARGAQLLNAQTAKIAALNTEIMRLHRELELRPRRFKTVG